MKRRTSGFTLIEVMAVVAILSVLTTLAVPAYQSSVKKSQENTCESNCQALRSVLSVNYLLYHSEDRVLATFEEQSGEYTCPLGGKYTFSFDDNDDIVVACSHAGPIPPMSDEESTKDLGYYLELEGLTRTNTVYTSSSSPADVEKIRRAFAKAGVDVDDFAAWSLLFFNGKNPKIYWTEEDISGIKSGKVYAMAYTFTTQHYVVWKVNVKNGFIVSELSGTVQNPVIAEQHYEQAIAIYRNLINR